MVYRVLKAGEKIAYVPRNPLEEPAVDPSFEVLEQTPNYLAVRKSGNIPCHPSGIFFKHTLWYVLKEQFQKEIHIITRLDRETSGVILCAFDQETAAQMTKDMMSGAISKQYLAIVKGEFRKKIVAEGFLANDPDSEVHKKRKFFRTPQPESESALTVLEPVAFDGTHSLVKAQPVTGRLHQIRATLCSLGFPLAGDKLYGVDDTLFLRFISDELTPEDREALILPGQALHALELEWNGKRFYAEPPEKWKERFPGLFH